MEKKIEEILIKDNRDLPKFLYHLVPEHLYKNFIDGKSYDCRYKNTWGREAPFIHTSPSREQLRLRVANHHWGKWPLKDKFVLLEIDSSRISGKVTYIIENGYTYHHLWSPLPANSFKVIEVKRDDDGLFLF